MDDSFSVTALCEANVAKAQQNLIAATAAVARATAERDKAKIRLIARQTELAAMRARAGLMEKISAALISVDFAQVDRELVARKTGALRIRLEITPHRDKYLIDCHSTDHKTLWAATADHDLQPHKMTGENFCQTVMSSPLYRALADEAQASDLYTTLEIFPLESHHKITTVAKNGLVHLVLTVSDALLSSPRRTCQNAHLAEDRPSLAFVGLKNVSSADCATARKRLIEKPARTKKVLAA